MNNGALPLFIEDGYTQSAYLEEVENVHPEIRFTFRPLTPQKINQASRQIREASTGKDQQVVAEWVKSHLVSLSAFHNGEPMDLPELTVDRILSMRRMVYDRIWSIICGLEGGDIDPKNSSREREEFLREEREFIATSEHRMEVAAKN